MSLRMLLVVVGIVLPCAASFLAQGTARAEPAATRAADFRITVDATRAPGLAAYGEQIQAVADKWYPKIAELLPSDGFTPRPDVRIIFDDEMDGVAYTSDGEIHCAGQWFSERPEDVGAVLHELTHVVQSYPEGNPGWLVEGIADWVRFFNYEPESARPHPDPETARYDASYRTSAHFLNWAAETYDKDLVVKLNAACREGRYSPAIWKNYTGKTVEELGAEWKQSLAGV